MERIERPRKRREDEDAEEYIDYLGEDMEKMYEASYHKGTNGAWVATGTYTGDGAESLAITGVGFTPKYVRIWEDNAGAAGNVEVFEKTDEHNTTYSVRYQSGAASQIRQVDNAIISLDSDGFTVDDAAGDSHPNKNGQDYLYLAIG